MICSCPLQRTRRATGFHSAQIVLCDVCFFGATLIIANSASLTPTLPRCVQRRHELRHCHDVHTPIEPAQCIRQLSSATARLLYSGCPCLRGARACASQLASRHGSRSLAKLGKTAFTSRLAGGLARTSRVVQARYASTSGASSPLFRWRVRSRRVVCDRITQRPEAVKSPARRRLAFNRRLLFCRAVSYRR